ncbi:MAG: hypothetical protein ABIK45_06355 [Pseudomonadota bacterium]
MDVHPFLVPSLPQTRGNTLRQAYEKLEGMLHERRHAAALPIANACAPAARSPLAQSECLPHEYDALLNLATGKQAQPLLPSRIPIASLFYQGIPLAESLDCLFHDCLGGYSSAHLDLVVSDAHGERHWGGVYRINPASYTLTSLDIAAHFMDMIDTWLTNASKAALIDRPCETCSPPPVCGSVASMALACRAAFRKIGNRRRLQSFPRWILNYTFSATLLEAAGRPDDLRRLPPPSDRFWADPFPIEHKERHYVFFEECLKSTGKGRICVAEIHEAGLGTPTVALQEPHHLSYPFLWQEADTLYMLPESSEVRQIVLYRCRAFPHAWEKERVLLEGIAAKDPTLVRHEGLLWLFFMVPSPNKADQLYVYYADSLQGPWREHKRNPVLVDCERARPGGHFFRQGNSLFRVSQDCSSSYGQAVVICRVDELTPERYKETIVCKASHQNSKEYAGFHTLNAAGKLVVADTLLRQGKGATAS